MLVFEAYSARRYVQSRLTLLYPQITKTQS